MKLSIVIPVYGVERFVSDCILSCISNCESNSEVEVIVVDDGSIDQSIEIVTKLIKGLSRFRIISQTNQGLSIARNNGLEAVVGEYVWFVDSDDMIAPGVVNQILEVLKRCSDLDMLELNYQLVGEDTRYSDLTNIPFNYQTLSVISGKAKLLHGFNSPVPFHVFRRAFLIENKLRMFSGIYHEDGEFTPRALWLAEKVATLPLVAYYYRQRRGSIMHTANPKNGEDNIFVAHRLMDFFDENRVVGAERRIVNDFIAMAFCNGLHCAIGAQRDGLMRICKAAFEHRMVLKSLRGATQAKYRVLGILASIFPKRTVFIYLLMMKINLGRHN